MNLYVVDFETDEPTIIAAHSIQDARDKLVFFGVKEGFCKKWRENSIIKPLTHDGYGVYKLY